jgi:hypothetical protein
LPEDGIKPMVDGINKAVSQGGFLSLAGSGCAMWKIALLGVVAVIAAAGPSRAEEEGAWCSHEDIGGGVVVDRCHFVTFAECHEISAGAGTFCTQNPRYVPPPPEPAAVRQTEPKVPPAARPAAPKKLN